jgi:hypothetical protein
MMTPSMWSGDERTATGGRRLTSSHRGDLGVAHVEAVG